MPYTSRETYELVAQKTNDPIVEWKTCSISGQPFAITQKDLEFYEKVSPTFNGKKYPILPPTLCPEERQRRRLAFRNERKLYRRRCDFSGKEIISIYSPEKPFKVYEQNIWWSDQWDPLAYGKNYDFDQTFTENFRALMLKVPRYSVGNKGQQNAEYCNHTSNASNCYLVFGSSECRDSMYGSRILNSTMCFDGYNINQSEYVFDSIDIYHSFNIFHSIDLENCSFCFGCVGLRNKQFCMYNQSYSREEYLRLVSSLPYCREQLPLQNYLKRTPTGEDIYESSFVMNSKNTVFSKDIYDCEDMKYCYDCYNGCADCQDCFSLYGPVDLSYECYAVGVGCHQGIAVCDSYPYQSVFYCDMCYGCSHCFGCIGLRNQSYCIFNQQYQKAEYETLVAQIVEQMQKTGERGEFLHPSLSGFGYNESVAQEYFPSSQEEAFAQGFNWSTYEAPQSTAERILLWGDVPARIEEVGDDILQAAIVCEVTGRLFRIEAKELAFYRKHHLPLPHRHPDQRHLERIGLRL